MLPRRLAGAVLALVAVPRVAGAVGPYESRADALAGEIAARKGKPEAVAPLGALVRLDEELPPGRVAEVLRTLVGAETHPLVAAQAAYQLSLEEERRGQEAEAQGRRRRLGLWQEFWVVGPFDAQGRSGLPRVYGPEKGAPDPRRPEKFPGKEREVGWRRAPPAAIEEGALVLDGLLRPESDAVAYALAVVDSRTARPAVLRLGSAGPVKVWVNGAPVLERNVVRRAALDQNGAAVSLRAGENWVLVKTVVTAGGWRLFLRFTDAEGQPLAGLAPVADPRGPAPKLLPGKARPRPVTDLDEILRRRADSAPAGERAARFLDQARFFTLAAPEDADDKPVERALRAATARADSPAAVQALLLLGEVAREDDDRRAALERASAAATAPGDRCLALEALGALARRRHHEAAALAHWRRALEADPECWPAQLAIALEEQGAGLPAAALARVDALPVAVRAAPRVARTRARLLEALGRRREAEAEIERLARAWPADPELLADLAASARSRGDLRRASDLYGRAAARRPEMVFVTIEAARAREAAGDLAAARGLLAEAALRLPDEPRLHEELGKLQARAGKVPEALAALERSLVLRPQNPTLRHYRERLAADGGQAADRAAAAEDLARRFAADAEALAKGAVGEAPDGRADGTVVLLDRRVVRVHGNGLSESFVQRVIQVRTERAARDSQELYVRYSPGSQEAEIRTARLMRKGPAGELEVSEATGRDDRDLSEPWAGLYYDNRAAVVSYEGLRAGDVIELQYTLADVGLRNEMADYFGDFQLIGDTSPKRRWDYTLIGPAGRTFFFNEPKVNGLSRTVEQQGADAVYRFSVADVPRVVPEPSMPGFAEVAPYLHVSTYKSWQDVARWYWGLVEDQLTPDDNLRRAAAEATARLGGDLDKVRALHRLVLERTRYVGLEFGIHGYKPYKVTQVLTRGFGDCKDKASLLLTLLRESGIDAELVLVRTRRGGHIDPVPASLAVFDHAIVFVPALSLYLDGTAEFSGMNELPSQDQGVMVLRVGPHTATLAETPVFPASANRAERHWRAELDGEGGAQIAEDLTISGQAAPDWRIHYQTPGERQERLAKVWSGRFPGARLDGMSFEGIEDRNHPVAVRSRVHVPQLAEARAGGELTLPITARDGDFVRSYARLSQRRHDLQVAYPWQHEEELVFRLPAGWRVLRQPAARHEQSPFGRFDLEIAPVEAGRAVRVRSLLEVQRHRIPPSEYGAFRKFLGTIDGALGERLVLGKEES
jgi:tetratricopeptide (TPR) repeat protein